MQIFLYLCTMISENLTSEVLFLASDLLASTQKVVILTHMSPDGDAMGSSLGFAHFLRTQSKTVTHIVPNAFPSFLAWMPGAEQILNYEQQSSLADEALASADLIVCTDFNEPMRIGAVGAKLIDYVAQGTPCLLVDHHLADLHAPFLQQCALAFIDHRAPAASLLVYKLLSGLMNNTPNSLFKAATDAFTLPMATALYTGLMTDTGNFSFNSNCPELYEIVADLLRKGVDKDAVYNATFNQYSADRMRLMGFCLHQKMHLLQDNQVSLIYLSRRDLYRFHFQSGDAEGIVNLPMQIASCHYSCFMREDKLAPWEKQLHPEAKTKVKISLRSQGNRPVNVFARDIFHGGGHANASGGEFYGASIQEAVQLFMDNYATYLNK